MGERQRALGRRAVTSRKRPLYTLPHSFSTLLFLPIPFLKERLQPVSKRREFVIPHLFERRHSFIAAAFEMAE